MTKKELWKNLANYHFENLVQKHLWDDITAKFQGQNPYTLAFADKLRRKFGWKKNFALRAIWEYKKFVFLGVIADFGVTPSRIIDQVWHEHILFSAGYRLFCQNVIAHNFDHSPELVAIGQQTEVFQAQYFRTIQFYINEFGSNPTLDVWGETKFANNAGQNKIPASTITDFNYASGYVGSETLVSTYSTTEGNDFSFNGGDFGGAGAGDNWDSLTDISSDFADSDSGTSCSSGCGGGD